MLIPSAIIAGAGLSTLCWAIGLAPGSAVPAGSLGGILARMEANEKEALGALRKTCTMAVQDHQWFGDIPGLMPELEAVLHAAGGPREGVHGKRNAIAFHASWRELRNSCGTQLRKLGPDHPLSGHLKTILSLTDLSLEARRAHCDRYF